jgi:hypothetical protein
VGLLIEVKRHAAMTPPHIDHDALEPILDLIAVDPILDRIPSMHFKMALTSSPSQSNLFLTV